MATLPCPRCGNTKILGTFCKDCLRELYPLVKSVKKGHLTLCATCDNVKLHSDWKKMPQADAVTKALAPCLVFGGAHVESVEFAEATIMRKPGVKKKTDVLAVVSGHHTEAGTAKVKSYEEEYDVPLDYEVTLCQLCRKRGTAYYEGILQIRNQTHPVRTAIYEYIAAHRPKGLRLAKEVPVATGSDYYISDQRNINHLAKQLHAHFGGELKISAQHFSYDHSAGKNLYRVNAYLEIPEFGKGTVIKRDDEYYYVLGVSTKVKAENLRTGSQENFPYLKGSAVRLPVKTTQVVNISPVQVLHPVTFQAVVPTNSKYAPAELAVEEQVSVAVDGDHVFLIPYTEEKEEQRRVKKRHSQKRKTKDDDLVRKD